MLKTLVSLLLLIAPVATASGLLRGSQDDNAIFCHLFVATGSEAEAHGDETLVKYQCLFDDNESRRNKYEIDLPVSFLKEHQRIIMQNPVLRIPGGTVTKHSVHVPENADITIHAETSPRRRLAPKSGTPKTLTVRVIANGNAQPQNSKSQLQGRVFGVGGDAEDNTVFTQYKKCSFGAQDIQPATSGNGVQSGVVDVNAPIDIASCNILGDCQDQIIAATERQLGIRTGSLDSSNPPYDFVMFCMPDGSMFGEGGKTTWAAFAYTGDRTAFFQKGYCGVMSTAMHELGHLMGFGHSNEGGSVRQDKSGVLGSSIGIIGGPNYCLNGHKFALSGWMDERKKVVSTSSTDRGGYVGRLVAFVDMKVDELVDDDKTLLEINTGNGNGTPNAYVVYNRKKSFNDGTREKGDLVTVVQQSRDRDIESEMVGALDAGDSVIIPGTSIVVKVCALDSEATFDFAKVSVYDTSLGQSSNCNVALNLQNQPTAQAAQQSAQRPAQQSAQRPAQQSAQRPAQQIVQPTTQTIVTQNQQTAQQIVKPTTQTIVTQNTQQNTPTIVTQQPQEEEQCFLRDIGQICRRGRQCCSGNCSGSGWNAKCAA
jgi:hypothetical protein